MTYNAFNDALDRLDASIPGHRFSGGEAVMSEADNKAMRVRLKRVDEILYEIFEKLLFDTCKSGH